ncbi:zinc finger CCCH domain-containing protein 17 [Gastrolobium bilobum]|uniref:zinc finger CCCH domain-containing protein 17 n=1 Tax=Gastrolobium bilobum TaxID=150636 RepID=UPI002AB1FDFC|nr:zinc finger CCCH domain-containing protein 17 [Gastrolobium bilobum]
MVAQQPQLQVQVQTQQPTPSAQDEALKRNTDCVYFLASPLTCKKGNECEYRHSEYARVNPRDCWYWLNGNCLNPKCSFRHPPLDGLIGTQATTPGGPSVPPSQIATMSATPTHAPYNSSKQAVPCIFFQKGLCLKGDRCAFLHGPSPNTGNKVTTQVLLNSPFKKPFGSIERHTQERKTSQGNVASSVGGPETKSSQKVETAPQRNMFELEKHVPLPPAGFDIEASRFKITSSPPVTNGPTVARSNRLHQARVPDDHSFHSGKDSDEFLRESSPGFDVLVADELRNSDYYHGEDEFGKARGQDERTLDSLNEYDLGHSADYSLAADIDRERFRVPQGYDSYDHMQEPYAWEQHRKAPAHLERRTHRRSDSPDNVEVSDLRHRLSKRKKVNGLKSVVTHDYALESHGEEQSQRFFSRKDSPPLPMNDSSLNNRFRGRIKLPANGGDDHLERESDKGRIRSRLSSGRLLAPHQGRIQDRVRGRSQDDERRNFRDRSMGRELVGGRSDFAGPKSLAELKTGSNTENKEQQSLGKRKSLRDHQQSEDDFLFEGPKPLSEILKEKRGVGAGAASESGKSSDNKNREITHSSDHTSVINKQNGALFETKENVKNHLLINEEESKLKVTDAVGREIDNADVTHGQSSEDGMIYDEAGEYQEFEGDDQRDGDYDYEQVDEGEYEYEQVDEGENQEQEYIDDEDGDDFAKKIGAVLT